jgi:hypothetical protein
MKGFLRRALQSARGAEHRLKPLTGSVYAGNRRRQEFQPESWGEETVNLQAGQIQTGQIQTGQVQPGPGAVPYSNQSPQIGISGGTSTSAPATLVPVSADPREAAPDGLENTRERQRPSSVNSTVASSAAPPHRESVIRPAYHGGALQPVPLPAPLRPGDRPLLSSSQRNEGSRAEAVVPQFPQMNSRAEKIQQQESPRPAPSPVLQKVEPLLRPAMAGKPPSARPQLSVARNRPPQEPEIQVHIGRIEVIAAAPQPPKVPSPRPNRATSLADYLAGRNGRPR